MVLGPNAFRADGSAGATAADTCKDFSRPAAAPLTDAIAAAEAEAAEKCKEAEAVLREVRDNRRKKAEEQLEYDEDPEPPRKRRRDEREPVRGKFTRSPTL
jgi:hypothetical protein